MFWDDIKQFGCKIVIHCDGNAEKQHFFERCKRNGILPFLSPFAISGREYFRCVRSNGRFELLAYPKNQVDYLKLEVVEWKEAKRNC